MGYVWSGQFDYDRFNWYDDFLFLMIYDWLFQNFGFFVVGMSFGVVNLFWIDDGINVYVELGFKMNCIC